MAVSGFLPPCLGRSLRGAAALLHPPLASTTLTEAHSQLQVFHSPIANAAMSPVHCSIITQSLSAHPKLLGEPLRKKSCDKRIQFFSARSMSITMKTILIRAGQLL